MGEFYVAFDVMQAAIGGDRTALAKFDNAAVMLAKAEVDAVVRKYGRPDIADMRSVAMLAKALEAAVKKRNDRLFGVGEVAKRSRRFAMASECKYFGPAASVTNIGIKQ